MDAQLMEDLRRARMDREHDGQAMHIGDDFVHQPFQLLGLVHVGGAVHGKGQVLLRLQLQFVINSRLDKSGAVDQQGVDHHVANEEKVLLFHPETAQVGVGHLRGGEEIIRQAVGHHTVDFLGHGEVP